MGNFVIIEDFAYRLKKYFLRHPEKLPERVDIKNVQIKPFQNAWADKRLNTNYQYVRYMDILFTGNENAKDKYLHSFIITYSYDEYVIDVMKMEFIDNRLTV